MSEIFIFNEFFSQIVLPFLLVFTVIFAILQKSKILGEDKKQIDAIVGFVIGLLLVAVPSAREIVSGLMPILAIFVVSLLVFFVIYGFAKGGDNVKIEGKYLSIVVILAVVVVSISLLVLTGHWDLLVNFFKGSTSTNLIGNLVFILIIIGAIIAVVLPKGSS
jgi:hypothetical protein